MTSSRILAPLGFAVHQRLSAHPHTESDPNVQEHEADSSADSGMVTVEIACGFIAVILVLALVCTCIGLGLTQQALCRAVREGAREASMGGDGQAVALSVYRGHEGAHFTVTREGRWVDVRGEVPYWGPAGWGGGRAHCDVRTRVEQTVP